MQADGSLTPAYQAKIESLLAAAWASRIRVILCLEFDPQWLARTNAAAYWQHSVADLVGAHPFFRPNRRRHAAQIQLHF